MYGTLGFLQSQRFQLRFAGARAPGVSLPPPQLLSCQQSTAVMRPMAPARTASTTRRYVLDAWICVPSCVARRDSRASARSSRASPSVWVSGFSQ